MVISSPFFLKSPRFISIEEKQKREAADRLAAAKALSDQEYSPPETPYKAKSGGGGWLGGLGDVLSSVGSNIADIAKETVSLPGLREDNGQSLLTRESEAFSRALPYIEPLLSGNKAVGTLTAGKINLGKLPGPLGTITDVGLSPITLLTAGTAGIGVGGVRAAAQATARRLALETASGVVGVEAGQKAAEALPENTPGLVKAGVGLGAGALAGGGIYGLLRSPKKTAAGIEAVTQGLKNKGLLTSDAQFGGAGLREVIDEFGYFPSKQEVTLLKNNLIKANYSDDERLPNWSEESSNRIFELNEFIDNYDDLKRIYDATTNELDLGPGLADLIGKDYHEGVSSSGTPGELARINERPRYSGASPESLISDIKTLTDQLEENALKRAGHGLLDSEVLHRTTQLRDLHTEAARQGLNVAEEVSKLTQAGYQGKSVLGNSLFRKPEDLGPGQFTKPENIRGEMQKEVDDLLKLQADDNLSEAGVRRLNELRDKIEASGTNTISKIPNIFDMSDSELRDRRSELASLGGNRTEEQINEARSIMKEIGRRNKAENAPYIKKAAEPPTDLEHLSSQQLQDKLARLETTGLPESDKAILRKTYLRELQSRNIGGGASPETLVTPNQPTVGLSTSQKLGNTVTGVTQFLIGHGIKNHEVATPIAREYTRMNSTLNNQATNIESMARRVIQTEGSSTQINDALQRGMDSLDQTLSQFNVPISDELKTLRQNIQAAITHKSYDTLEDAVKQYSREVATLAPRSWLKEQVSQLKSSMATKAASTSPYKILNTEDITLPKEITDVLDSVSKSGKGTEAGRIYTATKNTLQHIWASTDMSFTAIQMLPTWADNPKLATQVMRNTLKTFKDPTAFAKWAAQHDELVYGTDNPTITQWIKYGVHRAAEDASNTDLGGVPNLLQRGKINPIRGSNRVFADAGNWNRFMLADTVYQNYKAGGKGFLNFLSVPKGATEDEIRTAIAKAVNRATGYGDRAFGGSVGKATLFAPRFLQSQLEMIAKSLNIADRSIEAQLARRQTLKLIGLGVSITEAINLATGHETEWNPTDSNFMRIRDIGGADISIFGPWDSLVRGLIRSAPQIDSEGDVSFGDPTYFLRTKLAPPVSTLWDVISGTNAIGQSSRTPGALAKNVLLPFSLRDIGQVPATSTAAGFFGIKGSPLTGNEQFDKKLEESGIVRSDPEYLIKRRDYIAQHPNDLPQSSGKYGAAQDVRQDISTRRKANEDATVAGEQTLVDFRDNRSVLLQEQRDKLGTLLGESKKVGDTKQSKWLQSYFDILDQAQDPISHKIDSNLADPLIAQWTNDNGSAALDFISRYLGAGLGPVEKSYYTDLRTLEADGYFSMPRYINMKSGLNDDEIASYQQQVSSARLANPNLQKQPVATTIRNLFGDKLTPEEVQDLINSTKKSFINPELQAYKDSHRKELMWFNPNADWTSYESAQNKSSSASSGIKLGKGGLPKIDFRNIKFSPV